MGTEPQKNRQTLHLYDQIGQRANLVKINIFAVYNSLCFVGNHSDIYFNKLMDNPSSQKPKFQMG